MKVKQVFILALMGLLIWSGWVAAEGLSASLSAMVNTANKAYRDGQFQLAADTYSRILLENRYSSEVYYNYANALYRSGHVGEAILAYERAISLNPRDMDIRYNLGYVSSQLEYRVKDKRNWYLRAAETALTYFSFDEVLFVFLVCFFGVVCSYLFVLLFLDGKPVGWIRQTLMLLTIFSAALLGAKTIQTKVYRSAIVVEKDAEVHFAPSDSDQVAFKLGEGLKVYVLDKKSEWSRINLVNGEIGWIRNENIREVEIPNKKAEN